MLEEFPGQLLVAEHHVQDPWQIPWTRDRRLWYGAPGYPIVMTDGRDGVLGAVSCDSAAVLYRAAIERRLAETGGGSPVDIRGGYAVGGGVVTLRARFELLDPVELGEPRAYLLVLEDSLVANGLDFQHVTRAAYEEDLALEMPGDTARVEVAIAIDPDWNPAHLDCIAFVQDVAAGGSKEIHQSARLPAGSQDVAAREERIPRVRILGVAPQPFAPGGTDRLRLRLELPPRAAGAPMALEVFDAGGRRIRRVVETRAAGPGAIASWDGRTDRGERAPAGVYRLRLITADGTAAAPAVVLR